MKVLHVITDLYTGGAERALLNLLSGGLAEHFESHVLNLREETVISRQIMALGVPVTNVGMTSALSIARFLKAARREITAWQPDLIQGWMYHGNLAATIASGFCHTKPQVLWNIRQTLYSLRNEKPMTRQIIRANIWLSGRPNMILYNSHLSRSQHELLGMVSVSGRVIPNGINTGQYHVGCNSGQDLRFELGIGPDTLLFGHVARLHPMKNHSGFIRAALQIADKFSNAQFLLIGAGVTYTNRALAELVPEAMRPRFHFLGERQDIPEVMRTLDVFCLNSLYGEAFPNVLGEAMATGLACIATDVGDCANILRSTGVIVPPDDDVALVTAMEKMALMTERERQELGKSSRQRVEDSYEISCIVDQYKTLYKTAGCGETVN